MVATAVAAGVAVLPLAYLVIRAGERGWDPVRAVLWRPRTLELALRSLELAALVTAGCLVVGGTLAWLVARTDLPARGLVRILAGLPLALPSYVAAFGWIGWRPELAGRTGAVLVLVTITYPYVYLPVLAALERCDPALEDAARSLGHGPAAMARRVVWPQVRRAATGGGLLVGLYALSDFGAVTTMRHQVLTSAIYHSYRGSFDRTPAAVLGCVLAAMAVALVVVEGRAHRRGGAARVGSGALRRRPVTSLGWARWPALLGPAAVLAVALGVPARGLQVWARQGSAAVDGGRLVETVAATLRVGALGTLGVLVLAVPVAVMSVRHPGWLPRLAVRAAYAGHALPGVVVGLSLVFFGVRWAQPIYQRLPLLVLAYVVLFLSLALGSIQNAVAQVPPALEDVARTLGRTAAGTWRSVTARLAAPGVGAAATLVFLTVMKELPATLFLRPTDLQTLATQMWSHTSSSSRSAAVPYAVAVVVLAALPAALLDLGSVGRARRRGRAARR